MVENNPTIVREVPPRLHKRKGLDKYLEENKVAILNDYYSMTLAAFLKRWRLSTAKWMKVKKLWEVSGKAKVTNIERTSVWEKHLYMEAHKEEIEVDLGKLSKSEVMEKWGISGTTYSEMTKGMKKVRTEATPEQPAPPEAGQGVAPLTEHEHYILLLGYQQAVRELLKIIFQK